MSRLYCMWTIGISGSKYLHFWFLKHNLLHNSSDLGEIAKELLLDTL